LLPYGTSQRVKLSDTLVLDARLTAEVSERSIAGQIEFWAKLGRAIEPLLQGVQVMALWRIVRKSFFKNVLRVVAHNPLDIREV